MSIENDELEGNEDVNDTSAESEVTPYLRELCEDHVYSRL